MRHININGRVDFCFACVLHIFKICSFFALANCIILAFISIMFSCSTSSKFVQTQHIFVWNVTYKITLTNSLRYIHVENSFFVKWCTTSYDQQLFEYHLSYKLCQLFIVQYCKTVYNTNINVILQNKYFVICS